MGAPQGNEKQGIQHQLDTLKRVIVFDDWINAVSAISQSSMGAAVQLDLSSIVSATAESVLLSLYIRPTANAYWHLYTSVDGTPTTKVHLQVYQNTINIWNNNYGIQKMATDKSIYYQAQKISGGGNATWIVRIKGYIEKA